MDLGNIIKSLAGGDLSSQPGAQAVRALDDARLAGDVPGMLAALDTLQVGARAALVLVYSALLLLGTRLGSRRWQVLKL